MSHGIHCHVVYSVYFWHHHLSTVYIICMIWFVKWFFVIFVMCFWLLCFHVIGTRDHWLIRQFPDGRTETDLEYPEGRNVCSHLLDPDGCVFISIPLCLSQIQWVPHSIKHQSSILYKKQNVKSGLNLWFWCTYTRVVWLRCKTRKVTCIQRSVLADFKCRGVRLRSLINFEPNSQLFLHLQET